MDNQLISREQAILLGIKHYFTGVACPSNHIAKRYVSNRACAGCIRARDMENFESARARGKDWRLKNLEKAKHQRRNNYEKNKERLLRLSSEYRLANIKKYTAYASARRALKLAATPPWADLDQILNFYEIAGKLSEDTGIPHEVDHIVPIQGKTVCGLHVAHNLQVLTRSENRAKHNRQWPDMWDILL